MNATKSIKSMRVTYEIAFTRFDARLGCEVEGPLSTRTFKDERSFREYLEIDAFLAFHPLEAKYRKAGTEWFGICNFRPYYNQRGQWPAPRKGKGP